MASPQLNIYCRFLVSEVYSVLSVCMIVKDEEAFLGECLTSLAPVAGELVIVDTGSTDGTVDIVRLYDARLFEIPWSDDFAAARNTSLEYARGDWILVVDADERLHEDDCEKLLNWIARDEDDITTLRIINPDGTEGRLPRLFKKNAGLRYRGRIHEQLVMPSGRRPARMAHTEVRLFHVGYTPEVVAGRAKIERNIDLLQRILMESPADVPARYHLACTYQYAREYDEAFKRWNDVIPDLVSEERIEALKCRAICISETRTPLEAVKAIEEVLRLIPDDASLHVRMAQLFNTLGDVAGLRREVDILSKLAPESRNYRVFKAIVYFHEQRYVMAAAEFAKLLVDYPDEPASYVNLAHVLITAGDAWDALATIEEGFTRCGPADEFARFLSVIEVEKDGELTLRVRALMEKFPLLARKLQ